MTPPVAVTFTIVVAEVLNSHPSGVLWKAPEIHAFFKEAIEDKTDETTFTGYWEQKKKLPEAILLRCALINNNDSIYLNRIEITAKLLWSCI